MNELDNSPAKSGPDKGKWFTYGGKVDENLMNMLKEAQKTAGIKKFSDFMNDMLRIYRENKQDTEPPQMQVIKQAVTDIITTTESLLSAMQIIENDKFKSIAEYQQRAQAAEENSLEVVSKVSELEERLDDVRNDLAAAKAEAKAAQIELTTEIGRRKSIEDMINRMQQLADAAVAKQEQAEAARKAALEAAAAAKNKAALLEATVQDIQARLDTALATIERGQNELALEKNHSKTMQESLARETIARNRLEERLQIIEPHYQATNQRLETLQTEISNLRQNEQNITQKALYLEAELRAAAAKIQELQKPEK